MSHKDQLVEQKIREYQSRLKHIDELIDNAKKNCEMDEHMRELEEIKAQRKRLTDPKDMIADLSQTNWQAKTIESAGPLALIDSVAQRIEKLVEKIDS